ncbi:MAG: 2-polyprenyl-6-methoxyphenol hydroxylase [Alphaproteobacteria bacterium]|nr:2-polyprenyl-6-methoxyphenol hydroxylase [Alphaproteobacteria bacterium]
MAETKLSVAIVGGGIGGLFAANALLSRGLTVNVYEQAPALGEVGAGVYLTPNAVRQLERVGLGPAVEKWGAKVGPKSHYFRHDGSPIAPVQVTDLHGWNATYGMHRADLVDFLAAPMPKGVVHCGHRAVGFEQDDNKARVKFSNGAVAEADVVVGADGIHSELRPYVFPPSTPVFSGSISYRGLVSRERLPEWPMERWQMWAGPGKHFLVFPVRHGEMVNYVGFVPADEEMKESWSAPGDPDKLRAEFEGWDPRITGVLAQVDHCFRWALYDREPLPTWTKGRLTLLGDAAHPMLPHLGQGANQSIEDGMALATILSRAGRGAAPQALVTYERLRRERVADVQLGARKHGLRVDSFYGDLEQRDRELAAHADFRKHLYAYDVVPVAEKSAVELA